MFGRGPLRGPFFYEPSDELVGGSAAVLGASTGNIDAFFAAGTPGPTNARVRHDGICTLHIATRPIIATDTSRGVMSSQNI